MVEELNINIGTGKDTIESIEEHTDSVIVNYNSNGQTRPIVVSKDVINFIGSVIDGMEVGERYTSVYVYNAYIRNYKIKSKIVEKALVEVKKALEARRIGPILQEGIISDVENGEVGLMSFQELIGLRQVKSSHYFKCYAAIRYFVEQGKISYNSKGSIWRIL